MEMELHPQQHPVLEGRAGQASLLCTVRGTPLEVDMLYDGVTFYKFLNISEPIFPKSPRMPTPSGPSTSFQLPASSLTSAISPHTQA